MIREPLTILALTASAGTALADPGHLADHGHGHAHWLGYALLAIAIAIPAGITIARRLRKPARA